MSDKQEDAKLHDEKDKHQQKSEEKTEEKVEEKKKPEMVSIDKEELKKLKHDLKDQKDKYLRLLAESENSRKRLQKEKIEMQNYARENLICDFLHPIDHFEKALGFSEGISEDVRNWMVGFEMILSQFKDVLAQNDIKPIQVKGKTFDSNYHEAMETEINEELPINTIIEEYVKGYTMGERIIRPAKVKVSKKKTEAPKVVEDQVDEKINNETIKHKED